MVKCYLTRKEEAILLQVWGNMRKKRILFFTTKTTCVRRIRKLGKRDFIDAESFAARDKICRMFAAECFELAKEFAKNGDDKLSLQYAKLAAKLLGLSLRPKKLEDIEIIKKVLADLKAGESEEAE
jgi:hypothetical protein